MPNNQDLILNWGSSFGYFSDAGNAELLAHFAAALTSGGELLIEVANPVRVIAGDAVRLIASGDSVPETWDAAKKRATVVFPATDFRGPVAASIRIYTTQEYLTLLKAAGEGFTPFTDTSERLIVRAKKP